MHWEIWAGFPKAFEAFNEGFVVKLRNTSYIK